MAIRAGATDSEAFYDRHWEHAETAADPHVIDKAARVLEMVPPGVRTVLDVGCGDGYLTHRLAEGHDVTACDRSAIALRRVRVPTVQASADALPLSDRSFDMVFSSQLLEHLPDAVLAGAARELGRVADRYVFLSVPNRETLRRRFIRCPRCRLEFHIDGHVQSFDAAALDRLLPSFERIATERCGPLEAPTLAPVEWLRQRACRRWFQWSDLKASCPRCGETAFPKPWRSFVHRRAERALDAAAAFWLRRAGLAPTPYWLMALYRRRGTPPTG